MTKPYYLVLLLLISDSLLAQQPVFRSQSASLPGGGMQIGSGRAKSFVPKKDSQEIAPNRKFAPVGVNIKVLPLFGEYEKTDLQRKEDDEFLKMCDANFQNRSKASEFFATRAWEYLQEGQADTAVHRFNLAFLLDDENVDAFWGLGVVEYQKGHIREAINLMQRGNDINQDDPVLMVDLATIYIHAYTIDKKDNDLVSAFNLLEKAIEIQPESQNAYNQLTLAEILNGQYDNAWEHFHKSYEIDPQGINHDILKDLLSKKPDPKGIFKK